VRIFLRILLRPPVVKLAAVFLRHAQLCDYSACNPFGGHYTQNYRKIIPKNSKKISIKSIFDNFESNFSGILSEATSSDRPP